MYKNETDKEKELKRLAREIDRKLVFTHVLTLTDETLSQCYPNKQTNNQFQQSTSERNIANLDEHGNWSYLEKALKSDTLYGRKEEAKYQDKAEIKVLEDVENKSKNDFKETIRNTVIEVVKYLQTLTKNK